jgi:hypothetical protein
LKASQETSFSPDEITFIQQVPKTLVTETFDYRFEFYDINNNFIPVRVEDTKTFVGGNTNLFNKSIEINADNLYFSFDSASNPANPLPPTVINFEVDTNIVTGSINYTSGAFDFFGNEISASEYIGGQYPGLLRNRQEQNGRLPFLTVQDFTGSRDDLLVQFIRFTAEVEGVSDSIIITRVEDGKGGVSFEIVPFRGTQIKNKESKTLEVQAVRVDGINRIDLQSGLTRDFSDAKLHLLSSSLNGLVETTTYVSLSQAITDTDFIQGVSAGLTGSGEIDYNAIFTRDAIDNELTLYLMDGPTSESILTSLILTDLKDGLNPGLVTSTADQFNIKYKPREASPFNPSESIVTASFQRRGTTLNPISASLKVIPSSSIEPKTELPQLFMFYETGAFDDTVGVVVTDYLGNTINNGIPGVTLDETSGNPISFYQAVETKQLNFEFTYTEPITSASVTANKSFFITPDGLPGQDSITIDIDPNPIALGSNHKGEVYDYTLANTNIQVNQGDYFLVNTASGDPGTFTTRSVVPTNIVYGTLDGNSTTTMSLAGFESMSALSASVRYDFDIYPYFTASLITASRTQKFTKVVEGGGAIEVTLDPIAVSFNADESGFISDYSSGKTEVVIKQNDEFFFYDEEDLGTPGTFVTASVSASNISFSEISTSFDDLSVSGSVASAGGEVLHFKGFGGMNRNDVSASILYNFKVYPYSLKGGVAGVPRIVSKKQTFSKVNDGSKARKVSLAASSDTIIYDGDGTKVSPQGSITLTATAFNTSGSAYFKFIDDEGGTIQVSSTDNTVNTLSPLPGTGSVRTYTVELRDGNPNGDVADTDSISISGVQEGSTAYSVVLSNPASSVTVEVDGTTYFDNAGTLIRAYKGGTELQFVEEYDESAVDPITFLPIGTFGQFSASIHEISSFLTQGTLRDSKEIVSSSGELYASSSAVSNWTTPESNTQGFITFKIDFENGRSTQFVQQSFSTVFEGATGPGLVVRGEWNEEIEYIFDLNQKRRDAVFIDDAGTVRYWATTEELINKAEYTNGDSIYTVEPVYSPVPSEGDIDAGGWQYLGEQDFFVAAKLAIFEESFVKNTINVGEPATDYDVNPQIAIVGGTNEPYISIGQRIQGYGQMGAYIGVTEDGGPGSLQGGLLSLSGDPTASVFNSLKWDGETLLIRGAIRQTDAGAVEPQLRGAWTQPTIYNELDSVIHIGQSWSANTAHTSSASGNAGPPGTGIYWDSSSGTGKTVSLAASTFVIEFDQDGNNPSPSSINVFASSSNFLDPYFKFSGGGSFFTDETTFTDGSDDDNDIVSSINISSATISDMPLQFRVAVSEGDQVEVVSDVINVFGVKPGSDTVPNFFITPIAGGTQIKNSNGTIELQVQKADISGITDITSGTDARIYSGSTLLSTSMTGIGNGGNGVVYNPTIAASAIDGTKTLLLKDGSLNVLDSITLLDVTDGLGGGSFIASNLKTNRDTSVTPNTFSPTTLTAQASFYDTSGTEYTKTVTITPSLVGSTDHMAVSTATGASQITITADDGDGTTITLGGSSVATKDVNLTAVFTDPATSQTTTINETFYIVSDGVDGIDAITVINTNQAHSLPASSAGVVSSYANSGTNIKVFEGVTELTYDGTGTSDGTWTVSTSQSPSATITIGSITDNGDDITVGNHSSMDNAEDTVTITYNITGTRSGGASFTATTTQTLTKVKDGTDGVDGAAAGIVYAGQWGLTLPDGSTPTTSDKLAYLSETDLVYVVKQGSNYYTCETTHRYVGTTTGGNVTGDVVKYPSNTDAYYIANQSTPDDPQADPSAWDLLGTEAQITPGGNPSNGYTLWSSFGAEFTSVATDILFANDVYADRTINVGTNDGSPVIALNADSANSNANPFISIGQNEGQGFNNFGMFMGFVGGNPVMSLVSGSSYMLYQSGSIELSDSNFIGTGSSIVGPSLAIGRNTDFDITSSLAYNTRISTEGTITSQDVNLRGTINAEEGTLGSWVIADPLLESVNGRIQFDADDESITITDTGGSVKFLADTATSLPSISAGESFTLYFDYSDTNSYISDIQTNADSYDFFTTDFPLTVSTATGNAYFSPNVTGRYAGQFNFNTGTATSGNPAGGLLRVYASGNASVSATTRIILTNSGGSVLVYGTSHSISAFGSWEYFGGGFSVSGDTKITLENGNVKFAKDCKEGDKVLAWDEISQTFVSTKIGSVAETDVDEYVRLTLDDRTIDVSTSHGFWYDGGVEVNVMEFLENPPINFVYIQEDNRLIKKYLKNAEVIRKGIKVYTLSIPGYQNYISNGIISHNVLSGDYYPTDDTDTVSNGAVFSLSSNLDSSVTYYPKIRYSGHISSFDTTGSPFYFNSSAEYLLRLSNQDFTFDLTLVSSGTFLNGAGLQVVSSTERYLRHQNSVIATQGNYTTDVKGGIAVDAVFGQASDFNSGTGGEFGSIGGAYNVAGHPYAIKGGGIIQNSFTSITGTISSTTSTLFGNVTAFTATGTGTYTISIDAKTGNGTNTSSKKFAAVCSGWGHATYGGSDEEPINVGTQTVTPSTGTGTINVRTRNNNNDDAFNAQYLQFLIIA